ncbi:hypothetical protein [Granulicella arctica]|uniref:hypothetical protein n=1 Tax=Granulicella arctica TaxID=940613 RepID=UPI0021E05E4E|nr:hypothetical protein [Granulicella arctica]
MSTPLNAPRLIKGGLALIDNQSGTIAGIIALQYNPDTMTRSFQIKGVTGDSGDHQEALRLKGPPVETIKVDAEIDATDQLEAGDAQTLATGIHAQLAAIETIVYPASAHLFSNWSEESSGSLEIMPLQGPLTVFIFGANRIVPVRITELSITEDAFDTQLNPVRAKVSLGMRVLTTDDLGFDNKGGGLFMAYLKAKEQLAAKNAPGTFNTLGITGLPI